LGIFGHPEGIASAHEKKGKKPISLSLKYFITFDILFKQKIRFKKKSGFLTLVINFIPAQALDAHF